MSDLNVSKTKSSLIFAWIFSLIISSTSSAEGISLEMKDGTRLEGVRVIEKELTDSDVTIFDITLVISKLGDVAVRLNGGEVFQKGDAATTIYALCYEGKDGTILAFESGEMGGADHIISSFGIFSSKGQYKTYAEML